MTEPTPVGAEQATSKFVDGLFSRDEADARQCGCPTCCTSRGLRDLLRAHSQLESATEAWLEREFETDMEYHYLRDEVRAVLALRWWKRPRRRLREALRVVERAS